MISLGFVTPVLLEDPAFTSLLSFMSDGGSGEPSCFPSPSTLLITGERISLLSINKADFSSGSMFGDEGVFFSSVRSSFVFSKIRFRC